MGKEERTQNRRGILPYTPATGRPSGPEAGFTLIEVMIAIFVVSVGLLAVGTMQVSALNGCTSALSQAEAVSWGQAISDELLARPTSSDYMRTVVTHPLVDDPTDMVPLISAQNRGYTVEWVVESNTPVNNSTSVTVTVSWQSKGVNRRVVLMSVKPQL